MKKAKPKPTVCLDFDGVIYPNFRFNGVANINGDPVANAVAAVQKLSAIYRVVVHSSRCDTPEGMAAIRKYLDDLGLSEIEVVRDKPVAMVYVDDRAVRFDGDWSQTIDDIMSFKQWQHDEKARAKAMKARVRRRRREAL